MADTLVETQAGRYSLLQAELAGAGLTTIGVLLEDPASDRLYLKFRRDFDAVADAEDAEVLNALADDLRSKAYEMGAERLLSLLEDTLSNTIRLTDRQPVLVEDFPRSVERLYRQHVQPKVLEFRTHLPRYSLAAAAGRFHDNQEVTAEGWEEAPEDLRITKEMFVAHVAGRSMEPQIPDGSLCVFRYGVTGSRQGRLVLAEDLGARGNDRYAVKRYRSKKVQNETGESWSHEYIRLEPLNPDYEAWELDRDPERYRIIAEFVRVLY